MIESSSTDPKEDEIILNEKNLRPEYGQTEDTAISDDFRLQGIMRNLRGKENAKCDETKYKFVMIDDKWVPALQCTSGCKCKDCENCVKCAKCVPERNQ